MTTADPYAFKLEDDCYHQLSDDPYETETNWWSWNVPERKIGGWIHTPYYPNRKTVTSRIFCWGPDGYDQARMAYYRKVDEVPVPATPDLRDVTFPGIGYSLKMLEPGMKYHLQYEDRDRDFALDLIRKSAKTASARLQFCRLAFGAAGSAGGSRSAWSSACRSPPELVGGGASACTALSGGLLRSSPSHQSSKGATR